MEVLSLAFVGSIERNVFLLPHTHPGKEEVHRQTSCGSSRVGPASLHLTYMCLLPYSHMFHRVGGRGSVLLFRRTLVKDNGLRVGQTEPVGPHDFWKRHRRWPGSSCGVRWRSAGAPPMLQNTNRRWPDILTGLWKHGWILWTLSFLSTWSSGDRSKNVNITSDLEYCSVRVLVGEHLLSALKTDTLTPVSWHPLTCSSHLARHVDGVLQQSFHLVQFLLDVVGLFDFYKP